MHCPNYLNNIIKERAFQQ